MVAVTKLKRHGKDFFVLLFPHFFTIRTFLPSLFYNPRFFCSFPHFSTILQFLQFWGPQFMEPDVWTLTFGPQFLDPDFWTPIFEPRFLEKILSIKKKLFPFAQFF